jgi:hypothetical protein
VSCGKIRQFQYLWIPELDPTFDNRLHSVSEHQVASSFSASSGHDETVDPFYVVFGIDCLPTAVSTPRFAIHFPIFVEIVTGSKNDEDDQTVRFSRQIPSADLPARRVDPDIKERLGPVSCCVPSRLPVSRSMSLLSQYTTYQTQSRRRLNHQGRHCCRFLLRPVSIASRSLDVSFMSIHHLPNRVSASSRPTGKGLQSPE